KRSFAEADTFIANVPWPIAPATPAAEGAANETGIIAPVGVRNRGSAPPDRKMVVDQEIRRRRIADLCQPFGGQLPLEFRANLAAFNLDGGIVLSHGRGLTPTADNVARNHWTVAAA